MFREAKRHGHSRPPDSGYGGHAWPRMRDQKRLRGVFGIDAVPPRGDGEIGNRQKGSQIGENEFFDFLFVERFDRVPIFMRIAQNQLAEPILRSHDMNPIAPILGQLGVEATYQGRQCGAMAKSLVMAQSKASCE